MNRCEKHSVCRLLYTNKGKVSLCGIYLMRIGRREGQTIWIVDGDNVFRTLYPAFIMGGNDQRYRFNPPGEVWIDNRFNLEELYYTLEHELIERRLMRERGWSYARAHEAGIALEKELREKKRSAAERKNRKANGPAAGVYRLKYKRIKGLDVWIVDGPSVRAQLNGDFSGGAHGYKYSFIPKNEIWLDSAISADYALYVLKHELIERELMKNGISYSDAYEVGLIAQLEERERQRKLTARHEENLPPVSYGSRERGAKVRKRRRKRGSRK